MHSENKTRNLATHTRKKGGFVKMHEQRRNEHRIACGRPYNLRQNANQPLAPHKSFEIVHAFVQNGAIYIWFANGVFVEKEKNSK